MPQEKATKFARIQSNRIKTMRMLLSARKYSEKPRKLHKQSIVERYANFGSTAYAPVQREGRFPEAKPQVGCFLFFLFVCLFVVGMGCCLLYGHETRRVGLADA